MRNKPPKGKQDRNRKGQDNDRRNKFKKERDRKFETALIEENETDEAEDFDFLQLEGRNSVLEALKSEKQIDKIFIKQSDDGEVSGTLKLIKKLAYERKIVVMEVNKIKLDKMSQSHNHQGVIAYMPAIEYVDVEDIIEIAKSKNEAPLLLVIDGITDPHNFGAIIRSAECAGAHGIIIPKRRQVGISSIVSKASAGAISHIPIAKVTNVTRTLEYLKENGFWIACSSMDGDVMYNCNLKGALALVIGGEGDGVSKLVRENCDFVVTIPMFGKIESLNASVATGVLLYEIVRQRNSGV